MNSIKFNIHFNYLLIFLCIFYGINLILVDSTFANTNNEMRALWVTRFALMSTESIHKMVHQAAENNFNVLIVQVRGRGDAYYNSNYMPRSEKLSDDITFDPLAELIKEAHKYNLQVHAWLNVYYIWSAPSPPISPEHTIHKHPNWITTDEKGRLLNNYTREELDQARIEGFYLSPANLEVQNHLINIVREIIENYNVDGIHLDYIRYPGSQYGYDIASRTRFMQEYYIDPLDLILKRGKLILQLGEIGYQDLYQCWIKWRAEQITLLVRDIYQCIQGIRPEVLLSAAVMPNPEDALRYKMQAWAEWLEEDIMDFIIIMSYTKNTKTAIKQTRIALETAKNAGDKLLFPGFAIYNQPANKAIEKIYQARSLGVKGICLFSYNAIENKPAYFKALKQGPYKKPTQLPIRIRK